MRSVVGVTPSGSTRSPSSALMKLDFPELNSPAMTRRKRPLSCSRASSKRRRSSPATSEPKRSERGGQPLEQLLLPGPDLLLALRKDAPPGQQLTDHLEPPGWSSTPHGLAVPALPSYLVASIGAYPGCRISTVIRRAGAVAGPLSIAAALLQTCHGSGTRRDGEIHAQPVVGRCGMSGLRLPIFKE